jgi:hypothetical protein
MELHRLDERVVARGPKRRGTAIEAAATVVLDLTGLAVDEVLGASHPASEGIDGVAWVA